MVIIPYGLDQIICDCNDSDQTAHCNHLTKTLTLRHSTTF